MFSEKHPVSSAISAFIDSSYLMDETECITQLLQNLNLHPEDRINISRHAMQLVRSVRERGLNKNSLDIFLKEYDLSSKEGIVLMCLAESLLRIPDTKTADELIIDKLTSAQWENHLGASDSIFVNASTWGLVLTGQLVHSYDITPENPIDFIKTLASRIGEPLVRNAITQAMHILGNEFVMGESIINALIRSQEKEKSKYLYSFDMLGEAAITQIDAEYYYDAYIDAINKISEFSNTHKLTDRPSISIKLSALCPRYELSKKEYVLNNLLPRLLKIAICAKNNNIDITIDAEESYRLTLCLELFERIYRSNELDNWHGLGLAIQTYQKRASSVIQYLINLTDEVGKKISIRLVKGAYWDTEIKYAQEQGLADYPVFTRKVNTDISYIACAKILLSAGKLIYPQFATHNAHTISSILHFTNLTKIASDEFEFQRLHGMGQTLYDELLENVDSSIQCRVYAPVGTHENLLPYLVRRLLENGANTSFVNRIINEKIPIEDIVADPIRIISELDSIPNTNIPLPGKLFEPTRTNSKGFNFANHQDLLKLKQLLEENKNTTYSAEPIIGGKIESDSSNSIAIFNPSNKEEIIGYVNTTKPNKINTAIDIAYTAQTEWNSRSIKSRANLLLNTAELYEKNFPTLINLCIHEAGKTLPDAVAEVREAIDFLRYYAACAIKDFSIPIKMPGPTGEYNQLALQGRGVFVCISPWNFPLAIFTGQIAAALVSGNTVLAKPAEQTSLIAAKATKFFYDAGIPEKVLHFIPGSGSQIGNILTKHKKIAGVAFTGSTQTARTINCNLATRDAPLATLIAETGGQNAMLVDSSALPEQVVLDSIESAFNSAGQRCSALRILCIQIDVAPKIIQLLCGYAKELTLADPGLLNTDVGPVINKTAYEMLYKHVEDMRKHSQILYQHPLEEQHKIGYFFPPTIIEIDSVSKLKHEVFGPILHIIRYQKDNLNSLLNEINDLGYGLTLGIHSRIDNNIKHIYEKTFTGNTYVNRNMIGAAVGVQPFGGCGLSGTGPKAGGPHYLHGFATERTLTINTSAIGGNTELLNVKPVKK